MSYAENKNKNKKHLSCHEREQDELKTPDNPIHIGGNGLTPARLPIYFFDYLISTNQKR